MINLPPLGFHDRIDTGAGCRLIGGIEVCFGGALPGLPEGGSICPAGTRCRGVTLELEGIGGVCLGSCEPFGNGRPTQPPIPSPSACPAGTFPVQDGFGGITCVADPLAPTPTPRQPPQNGGCPATCAPSCVLPNGRKGKTNKGRYYRFGDCRTGTTAGVVEPGTVCVARRSTNYGNMKAAARAARRIDGALRHMDRLHQTVKSALKTKRHR